ncbi:FAD-dependent oxidoreductase [Lactiplantibacillus daowaiensis]|uniref:Alpha-glycerophosphate oxidase n=1 Tax=Lactiplantibacillus daowaiensis TaxID=2559918 RepID=A0ABW1S135_9LACO|nr:FAD-dependent oxidoreductase [Lactiplantibacillus daowaiensis]
MSFSMTSRQDDLKQLKSQELDLLIIGGGITGAGVALQASVAGMQTGLIDMQDFGGGTSSRSTRLVHGGIRYLKTFDVEVVSDTVKERAVVQHIAPHMTQPDPMLLPIYDEPGTTFSMFSVKVAMDLYDRLAGVDKNPNLQKYSNYVLTKAQVLEREPQLNPDKLVGAGVYLDYQNNDSRLVVENIKRAHDAGGLMVSRIKAIEALHDKFGDINGMRVQDCLTGEEFDIHAKLVINTSGPWSDEVRHLDQSADPESHMRPTKGVHLVVDQSRLKVPNPTYFGSGTNDGRMIFTIPREGKTYFGTTDTDFEGDYENPQVDQKDVDYLLGIINKKYPTANLTIDDVEASWAGIRPLVRNEVPDDAETDAVSGASAAASLQPSAVSRGSSLVTAADGMITLAGGKLTDYRLMANGAIKQIRQTLRDEYLENFKEIDSAEIKVSGGDFDGDNVEDAMADFTKQGVAKGLTEPEAREIATLYGSNAPTIFAQADQTKAAPGLSLAETLSLHYSMDEEMALTPVDYLLRRTYNVLFHSDTIDQVKVGVIDEMARYYNWDAATKTRYTEDVDREVEASRLIDLKLQAPVAAK